MARRRPCRCRPPSGAERTSCGAPRGAGAVDETLEAVSGEHRILEGLLDILPLEVGIAGEGLLEGGPVSDLRNDQGTGMRSPRMHADAVRSRRGGAHDPSPRPAEK